MTEEQQRIAIAEACGWKDLENEDFSEYGVPCFMLMGSNNTGTRLAPPDYLNDLNAMNEAEKVLPRQLSHIDYWQKGYGRFQTLLVELSLTPYSATAAQRAEALLRTIGKWTTNQPTEP